MRKPYTAQCIMSGHTRSNSILEDEYCVDCSDKEIKRKQIIKNNLANAERTSTIGGSSLTPFKQDRKKRYCPYCGERLDN